MSTCPARHPQTFSRALCAGFTALLLAAGGGCNQDAQPEPAQPQAPVAGATADETPSDRCQDYANSIRDTFTIDRLGASTDLSQGVSLLNQWQRLCQAVPGETISLSPEVAAAAKTQFTPAELTLLTRSLFVERDGEHLRSSTLSKAIQAHAIGAARGDLERAVSLFQHVVRNMDLIEQHPDDIPLSLYEICMLGKGTTEDRAWLFAELLRQLRIDTVVLTPAETLTPAGEDQEQKRPTLLVGVLLADGVYLFEPRMGIAVPAEGSTLSTPASVATLAALGSDPTRLAALTVDPAQPYPLSADQVSRLVQHVVGNTALWSPRMEPVQEIFTGDRATVVFERLAGTTAKPGLLDRVARAPHAGWKPDSVRVWAYPERQLEGYGRMSALHQQTLTRLIDSWQAPSAVEVNQEGWPYLRPKRGQWKARMFEMMGRYEEAVKEYTKVQLGSQFPPQLAIDPRTRLIHQQAGEDAQYWMALCKFEQGRPADRRIAVDKIQHYLQTYPQGPWVSACHYLLALDHASRQEYPAAVAALQQIPADHPQHAGFAYLVHAWQSADAP